MLIVSTPEIPGKEICETLGLVSGNMVKSKHVGRDIMAGLKTLIGGEIAGYTEMLTEAREEAQKRMIQEAKSLGGDAIVNVRFTTSAIAQGMSELLAYGTAVKLQ
ncbi:MAG: heavy metal-binding domain-containing protein [Lentisphaeraceae bacterium]|nr:heavy metal-binding domain-containing protein [Lentisphaeraceae bacterium]